jgi:hypothetical protein
MLCIGMGKHQGALVYHRYALRHGFFELLEAMGQCVLERGNVRFGVAVVEDARDETMHVEAVPKDRIWQREAELLELSKQNMPRLPLKRADVLVILEIGKEISGSGMDPNVTGRAFDLKEDDFSGMFQATRVAILNLSRKTGGNAIGLGNADIITEKVYRDLDYEATLMNALTSFSLRKAFIPVRLPNDRKAIQACYTTLGPIEPEKVRAVIVRDTLHLQDFLASRALLEDLRAVPEAEILERAPLEFDASGDIRPPLWLE